MLRAILKYRHGSLPQSKLSRELAQASRNHEVPWLYSCGASRVFIKNKAVDFRAKIKICDNQTLIIHLCKSVDKMRLSKNFTMEELCRSATAERHGIKNWPATEDEEHRVRENLRYLCFDVLQPLREHVGKPIVVNSGYRSKKVNRLVGGVKNSQHLTGEAADLRIESTKQGREWAEWIMDNCDFDQMLLESNGKSVWLHVSAKRDKSLNRRVFKKMKV